MNELLENITEEELKDIILNMLNNNREIIIKRKELKIKRTQRNYC